MAYQREAMVFYLTRFLSADPRIHGLTCFRHRNKNQGSNYPADYRGIAAYAMYYDDPFDGVTDDAWYHWRTGEDDMTVEHERWTREQSHVKNNISLPGFDLDDVLPKKWPPGDTVPEDMCDCNSETRSKIINAHPNVCLQVWVLAQNVSAISHINDNPMIPFYEGVGERHYGNFNDIAGTGERITVRSGDYVNFDALRDWIIYVNDYNTAVRYDRLTGSDPVDSWQNPASAYFQDSAGTGDFWMAAPCYNDERAENDDELLDQTGRLVASGNNSLYVWDKNKPTDRLEFSVLTGHSVIRQIVPR